MRAFLSQLCPGLPQALSSSSDSVPNTLLTYLVKERSSEGDRHDKLWETCTAEEISFLKSATGGGVMLGAAVDDMVLHACRAWSDVIVTSAANLRSEPDLDHRAPRDERERLVEWRAELGRERPQRVFVLTREDHSDTELDSLRAHGVFQHDASTALLPGGRLMGCRTERVRDEDHGQGEGRLRRACAGGALENALDSVALAWRSDGSSGNVGGSVGGHGAGSFRGDSNIAAVSSPNVLVQCGTTSTSELIARAETPPFRFILLTIVSGYSDCGGSSTGPARLSVQPHDTGDYVTACASERLSGCWRVPVAPVAGENVRK